MVKTIITIMINDNTPDEINIDGSDYKYLDRYIDGSIYLSKYLSVYRYTWK